MDHKNIIGVIDNYQKGYVLEVRIYSFQDFLKLYNGETVIIASKFFKEMRQQLNENGIYNIKRFCE